MQRINDAYSVVGNDVAEFKRNVKEMNDITKVSKIPLTKQYTFMSVLAVEEDVIKVVILNDEFIALFNSGAFFTMNTSEGMLNYKFNFIRAMKKDYFPEKFFEERIKVDDLLILTEKNAVTLISDEAYRTMLVRFNLSCDGMLTKTLARNVMIAERLYHYEDVVSTVVTRRNEKGYEKVMAVLSEKYTHIPQTILSEVITELEKSEKLKCMDFSVDNRISYINLRFSEKEKEVRDVYKIEDAIPGIYLATSDTGDCSITAKAFFNFGGSKVYVGDVTRRHEGNIDKDVLLNDIKKSLFPMYTIIPDKLIALMGVEIADPKKAIKKALKHIHLVKLIGKKNEMLISEQLLDEVSPAVKYTGYDIAIMVLQIAKRIQNISGDAKRKLESGVISVIDCDFGKSNISPAATLAD